jgi:hypothetical protein
VRVTLVFFMLALCSPHPLYPQELKRRPETPAPLLRCIAVELSREKGVIHYEYLTGQTAKGDLNYELAEEKLTKGADCRIDIILDESTIISDLKLVPRMAVNAGYWDVHVYVHWNKTNAMAEITLLPRQDGHDEIQYGPVLRFDKKRWKSTAS